VCVCVCSDVGGHTGAVYGDHGVRFNDDGRPLYPGQNVRPTRGNLLFWRRERAGGRADDVHVEVERYRPYSRTTMLAAHASQQVRGSPFITRRFDAPRNYQTTNTVTTMRPEIIVVEEMKISDEKPCACWLFLVLGVVMLIVGVLNMIWCWQYHWFSRFWCSILVCSLHYTDTHTPSQPCSQLDLIVSIESLLYIGESLTSCHSQ